MSQHIEINADLTAGTGQPDPAELSSIASKGFAAVIDLRVPGEANQALPPETELSEADRLGLSYANIPVPSGGVTAEHLDRFRAEVARLPKPIFVHCASGRRAGSFAMVEAALREGLSGEEMLRRTESLGVAPSSDPVRETYRSYVDVHLAHPAHASGGTLPPTASRVEAAAGEAGNRQVVATIDRDVRQRAGDPVRIDTRLAELDREWDMERTLETNAAALALTGTLLGAFVDRRFLVVPAVVTSFLLQHALQGWCPPVPFFRRRGVRTAREIETERHALKALRGDYRQVPAGDADAALAAARA
jgi:uncharacterized protein (TIGR01244 family)